MEENSSFPPKAVRAQLKHFQKYIQNVRRFKHDSDKKTIPQPLDVASAAQDVNRENNSVRKSEIAEVKNLSSLSTQIVAITNHQIDLKEASMVSSQTTIALTSNENSRVDVCSSPLVLQPFGFPAEESLLQLKSGSVIPHSRLPLTEIQHDYIQFTPSMIQQDKDIEFDEKSDSENEDMAEYQSSPDDQSEKTRSAYTEESMSDEDDNNETCASGDKSVLRCESSDGSDVSDLDELFSTDSSESSDSDIFDDGYYSRDDSFDYNDDDTYLDQCQKSKSSDSGEISKTGMS